MSDDDRDGVLTLLRQALAILDAAGESRAAPYLQFALDLLGEDVIEIPPFWMLPTCH